MMKRLLPSVLICSSMILGTAGADAATSVKTPSIPSTGYSAPEVGEYNVLRAESETVVVSGGNISTANKVALASEDLIQPLYLSNSNTFNFYDILEKGDASGRSQEQLAYSLIESTLASKINAQEVVMENVNDLNAVRRAYCAFVSDHPEYFWLYDVEFELTLTDEAEEGNDADDYDPEEIKFITLKLSCCLGQTFNTVSANYNTVTKKVTSIVSGANKYTTDYEKIKYFAEYICENTEYNYEAAAKGPSEEVADSPNCWNAYGALINGKAVCEGYAEAFKLLCDEAGIPCALMYSTDHEWNAVKLNDTWYYVDVTNMDTTRSNDDDYAYGWILTGTEDADSYDSRYTETIGSHILSGDVVLKGVYLEYSDYIDISEGRYKLGLKAGDLNKDGKINNKDLVLLRYDANVVYEWAMPTLFLPLEIAEVCDLNDDGYVAIDDADVLKEWIVSPELIPSD